MTKQLDVVTFAEKVLGKHLFDWEKKRLSELEGLMEWNTFNEWVRPPKENQYLVDIYMKWKAYVNGDVSYEEIIASLKPEPKKRGRKKK